ncbi:MAG: biopolymer transporter ExbD, partial [Dysgonamonadaceae bacterium]|nr:biopolymer transporter ExbD [Dysgonamonadaceae bacterium]
MSRFRTSRYREVPMLNTSSLPDLIFTILFFFMLVTHGQPFKQMAKVELPTAAELQKLEEKSLVIYIVVSSKAGEMSDAPVVQLNSDEVSLENLPAALETA